MTRETFPTAHTTTKTNDDNTNNNTTIDDGVTKATTPDTAPARITTTGEGAAGARSEHSSGARHVDPSRPPRHASHHAGVPFGGPMSGFSAAVPYRWDPAAGRYVSGSSGNYEPFALEPSTPSIVVPTGLEQDVSAGEDRRQFRPPWLLLLCVGMCFTVGLGLILAFAFAGTIHFAPGVLAAPVVVLAFGTIISCILKWRLIVISRRPESAGQVTIQTWHWFTYCCPRTHTCHVRELTDIRLKLAGFHTSEEQRFRVQLVATQHVAPRNGSDQKEPAAQHGDAFSADVFHGSHAQALVEKDRWAVYLATQAGFPRSIQQQEQHHPHPHHHHLPHHQQPQPHGAITPQVTAV